MKDYSVKPPQVEALGAALEGAAHEIDAHLASLRRSADSLAGRWQGDASDAYQGRQSAWSHDMAAHAQALRGAADAARTAAAAYEAADERVGGLWGIG